MTDELKHLVADIETALAKGHRGFTIRGPQMDWVVHALRVVIESQTPSAKKRPFDDLVA